LFRTVAERRALALTGNISVVGELDPNEAIS